jgi:signal transduction histidine kinase
MSLPVDRRLSDKTAERPPTEIIKEMEQGNVPDKTEIIRDPSEAAKIARKCFENCEKEILIILASQQVIERNLPLYEEMIDSAIKKKIAIRVLVPAKNGEVARFLEKVDWRAIDEMNVGYAIYDRKKMLITQYSRSDDSGSLNRIQANIFTTNREHIAGIVSVFNALWKETELREAAERSRRRAELFQDILSHDLRNHLQIIGLNAEQLQEELKGNRELQALIENMLSALERSKALLERARQLGRVISEENPRLHAENLVDVLDKSMELVRNANPDRQVEYTKALPRGEAAVLVRADEMLVEVFTNIFTNSIKYTESGKVKIAVSIESPMDGTPEQGYWKISVADWASGIAAEMKERIFHRYMGGAKGTGLGLSIVQSLVVDRYRGRADVKDRVPGSESEGTVVDVWLLKA